ncbi:MAG: efflux RND transporter periplasmic adaptor subunit [Bryobacterales bacterium]|jgi:multidrug efflux pump subunit AcrA (membrane-fusion protein)|nr:efflux RND transporter periplasmic adaptor subunit [Bryobacterales bacterium]
MICRLPRLFALCLVFLASCGSQPDAPSAPAPVSSPAAAAEDARLVELTPEALRQISILAEVAQPRRLSRVLSTAGRITMNENRTWRVGAVTDGRIVDIARNVGDTVREGELLARMFSHEIHEARAEFARAKSELARLQSRRTFLQTSRDRAQRLYALKAASLQQVQQAEAELLDQEGEIRNAETELERTRFHLEEYLRVKLESNNSVRVAGFPESDLLPIRSPASGAIIERTVTPGTVVQPATTLFVVSDLRNVWMIAAVQQQDLSLVRMDAPVQVRIQAYPETAFAGRVRWIGSELDPSTRTVNVRVELPNPALHLRPEMYASADIALADSEEGLFLPQQAIQELNGQAVVFVELDAGRYAVRPLQSGPAMDGKRRVLSGLSAGDRVVVEGSFLLKSKLLEASLAD